MKIVTIVSDETDVIIIVLYNTVENLAILFAIIIKININKL